TRTLQMQACNGQALFRLKLLVLSFVHRNTLYETVLHFRFEAARFFSGPFYEEASMMRAVH
ncbi:hypothetical protein, partial [Paraburkholderia sp. UCT31]|uniref:hypothetical protein n=1 Tax=Paraburkholderia sp. UCT31 TaxID=2615209 RepID=UPI001CA435AC